MLSPAAVPLSLYVHIPWCVRKCPYCDFNSHALSGEPDQLSYVRALLADLEQELSEISGRTLTSIFIGGGTPSLFSAESIGMLLDGIAQRIGVADGMEVTLEANPGTLESGRYRGFRQAGVNRLSVGAQSLDNARLAALGRIHDSDAVMQAIESARRAGFDNFNVDMMYGLPGQGVADALRELRVLLALAPPHLSWYQLTIEPNTLFHHSPPTLPGEDELGDMMDSGELLLKESGYSHYEISAYAAGDRQSRHNSNYWEFGDYIGIGAGAHGKLTTPAGVVVRKTKRRHPADYLAAAMGGEFTSSCVPVPTRELPLEFMLNALRLADGVAAPLFVTRTGLPLSAIADPWSRARQAGLMVDSDQRLAPTGPGQRFLNDLLALFEEGSS